MCVREDRKTSIKGLELGWSVLVMQTIWGSHRRAVLHHGVVQLVALGCASGEEAALAHVVVEMLQTAIPVKRSLVERKVRLNQG